MSVLVFGEKGFVASNLILKFKKKKIKFESISQRKINLLKKISLNKKKKFSNLKKINSIIFISAIAPAKNLDILNKNIIILQNALDLIKDLKFNQLIYISSDAVYSDSMRPLKENSERLPKNFHGQMHNIREEILKLYFSEKICILRPSLLYGYNDTHNGYGPNKFFRELKKKRILNLFGNGEEKRDHVLIDDLIDIISLCIKNNTRGTFNVSSGNLISFYKIAVLLKNKFDVKTKIIKNKRVGRMPHNGYRPISNKKVLKEFKSLKFNKFNTGIKTYEKN